MKPVFIVFSANIHLTIRVTLQLPKYFVKSFYAYVNSHITGIILRVTEMGL
jgi:hypothetical protein